VAARDAAKAVRLPLMAGRGWTLGLLSLPCLAESLFRPLASA